MSDPLLPPSSPAPAVTADAVPAGMLLAPTVSLAQALRFWLKLGLISFGGPAGQIALMHRELVERRRWISERRFMHALNYCMVLPGPEAQQLATYLGWLMHRTWGGVAAGALFVLPSLLLLIALSAMYMQFGQVSWVAAALWGIKPAVAAIVVQAAVRMGSRVLKKPVSAPLPWVLAALSLVGMAVFQLPFPLILTMAALVGWWSTRWTNRRWAMPVPGGGHGGASAGAADSASGASAAAHAPALIDDDTPTPPHARFSRARLVRVVAVGMLLWLVPMAGLLMWAGGMQGVALDGPQELTRMGWFFTKAALVTFGGAYAVLPYVVQGAVEQFAWLSAPQMMDGLALGETTPGPLIMVVAFVAFLGGWQHAVLGPDALLWGGVVAAVWVTWVTFLPSFVFILAGGPLVEGTHGQLRLTAPLAAITCAVVGVIANLAINFIANIACTNCASGHFDVNQLDGTALVLAGWATLALLRWRWGLVRVMLVCAAAGVLLRLAGWA
jgi:chromate transporter